MFERNSLDPKKLKPILYVRKSSEDEERQVLSIPAQIQEGYRVAKIYNIPEDTVEVLAESQSAMIPGRPEFNKMIDKIKKGDRNCIICWKLDRLARNPLDGGNVTWLLGKGVINTILTPAKVYLPEDNEIFLGFEFSAASQYSRELSVNVKRGNRVKLETGWWSSLAPHGYLNNSDRNGDPIISDPERFPLIKKIWMLLLSGNYSVLQILAIANNEWQFKTFKRHKVGGKKLSKNTLYKIFRDPFYYGYMVRGANSAWGKHKPMITKEEFEMAQKILDKNNHQIRRRNQLDRQKKEFPFRGLLRCGECGCTITIQNTTNRHGTMYTYYHCTKMRNTKFFRCSQKNTTINNLDQQIHRLLESIEIPVIFKEWGIAYIQKSHENESQSHAQVLRNYHERHERISSRLNSLLNLKLDNLIDEIGYQQKQQELLNEREALQKKIEQLTKNNDQWRYIVEKTFHFACHARTLFAAGSLEEKTNILKALGTKFVLKDGALSIELFPPFVFLKDSKSEIWDIHEKIFKPYEIEANNVKKKPENRPSENFIFKPFDLALKNEKNEAVLAGFANWRRGRDLAFFEPPMGAAQAGPASSPVAQPNCRLRYSSLGSAAIRFKCRCRSRV